MLVSARQLQQAPAERRTAPPSLLPPALLSAASLLWLWVLPVGILLLLNLQGFFLVEGNMDSAQRAHAIWLGISGAGNLLAGLALHAVMRHRRARPASVFERFEIGSAIIIAVQVAYLWFATSSIEDVLPASVASWIYPPQRFLFNQFAFAMLPLFLGVLRLACVRPARDSGKAIAINLAMAIGAPVLLYLLFNVASIIHAPARFDAVVFGTAFVALGVTMFVGMVRVLMLGLRGAQRWSAEGERGAILLFALVLPVCGMLLNRSIPFPVDFQAWEVYALVVANTSILLLASFRHAPQPRLSLLLLCATFPFSLYFFLVFLPYTPLSILAIIAFGAGFLVLTPTLLFTLHLHLLNKSRRALSGGRSGLVLGGFACFLILPGFFAARGLHDKAALNAALDHVYTPEVTIEGTRFPANRTNLHRALKSHRSYKNGIYYPILSDFYAWLVFDNLVLPDDKLARLEEVFFGTAGITENEDPFRTGLSGAGRRGVRGRAHMPRAAQAPRTAIVRELRLDTRPLESDDTIVTLALTLENTGAQTWVGAEYVKALPLPAGAFVTGFRLHINGTPVPGRIFEKKTALWVYTMIRDSERRDPGLLFYNTPDELELRVFPINREAPVTVEIDFLLPAQIAKDRIGPLTNDPAAALLALGSQLRPRMTREAQGRIAASGLDGRDLPTVDREPYLHLLIDRSEQNGYRGDFSATIRSLRERFPAAERARITLANCDVVDLVPELTSFDQLPNLDEEALRQALPRAGGIDLDLAVAHALRVHRDLDLDRPTADSAELPPTPVFIVLTRSAESPAPVFDLAAEWADLVTPLEISALNANGMLVTYLDGDAESAPLLRVGGSTRPWVKGRLTRFDAAGDGTKLEYWSPQAKTWQHVNGITSRPATSTWSQAVSLQFRQQDRARSPGDAAIDLKGLVQSSRESGVLLASTSYIVVENEAQWRMLEQSEGRKLGQNEALDFLETPAPPALWVAIGFVLWLWYRSSRRRAEAGVSV